MPPNRPPHRPGLQTLQGEVPHPSHCCGNPYSQDMRTLVEAVRMVGPVSTSQGFVVCTSHCQIEAGYNMKMGRKWN
jgi:hypothetical protein